MHLMIPHASALGDACQHSLGELNLPHLSELLGRLSSDGAAIGGDEYSLNTPQELALAQLRGNTAAPGALPTAAWLADSLGLDASLAWARLTPLHLAVGSDHITARNPEELQLSEFDSRALFEALAELWPSSESWAAHWVDAQCWLIGHASLQGLACASLDRVLARNVAAWMPEARLLRRLQNEIQMLLHEHPLNEAREQRGLLPVNSVWISGCGRHDGGALPAALQVDERLRAPLLTGDWAAWAEAWVALDAGPVARGLDLARAGRPVCLTLCGERLAQSYASVPSSAMQNLWQRIRPPRANTAAVLGAL
ncbi:hypothetical protein LNV23_08565 [Paucibacter sp. DJ1R-11]|uniref:hypothetical protein n=1 Tax=Paucibacter sp. DJ1R-11 TaxID=2893556 RepID=UPI0021E5059C|nr:hypothetical protein [Paucibacter sp. DJ1R-11]MCV2363498.1 hypothetical protein [Paucibacter sp. DJ1R-11]